MMAYDAQVMEQMSEAEILACLVAETGPTFTVRLVVTSTSCCCLKTTLLTWSLQLCDVIEVSDWQLSAGAESTEPHSSCAR